VYCTTKAAFENLFIYSYVHTLFGGEGAKGRKAAFKKEAVWLDNLKVQTYHGHMILSPQDKVIFNKPTK
jgi:hypothetical protein